MEEFLFFYFVLLIYCKYLIGPGLNKILDLPNPLSTLLREKLLRPKKSGRKREDIGKSESE